MNARAEIWAQWNEQEVNRLAEERADRYYVAWNNLYNGIQSGRIIGTTSNFNTLWRYATRASENDRFLADYMERENTNLEIEFGR